MKYYEVGYERDGYYSINILKGTEEECRKHAEAHAKRHGYTLRYMNEVSQNYCMEMRMKGMPLITCEPLSDKMLLTY